MSVEEPQMVSMRLERVVIRDNAHDQWIFLTEQGDGGRGFPIIIGTPEAQEIQRVVTNLDTNRPLTHQLALTAIEALGGQLVRIDITKLEQDTFFAQLVVERDGEQLVVDARPSDALALGLRAGCAIHVSEAVLEQVRTDEALDVLPDTPPSGEGSSPEDSGSESPSKEDDPETDDEGLL